MRPEIVTVLVRVRAAWDLLRLELKVLTGNRLLLMALVELGWLVVIGLWQHLGKEPWDAASFYNRSVLLPGLLPAIALGMAAVMGERDIRHVEMTLASSGGRYRVWAYRISALVLACLVSSMACAVLTWAAIDHDLPPIEAGLQATVPLAFVGLLTLALSLLFNGAASAALVAAGVVALSGIVLHPVDGNRFDLFLNPLAPPASVGDAAAWSASSCSIAACSSRSASGLCIAAALWLLQRRERLV